MSGIEPCRLGRIVVQLEARQVSAEESQNAPSVSTFDVPQFPVPREAVQRYIAESIDWLLQMPLGVLIIKSVPESWAVLQLPLILVVFLGYFLLLEGLFARTPGKLLTGLIVVQFDGRKCTWRQAWTRTWWRLFELNPIFLGGIPAALSLVSSPYSQRIGDRYAKTLVVPTRSLP